MHIENRLKKFVTSLFMVVFIFSALSGLAYASEPNITAPAFVLMDAKSGQVLWEKEARRTRPMASTTKMITGIIALEEAHPKETVTVSENASNTGGAELYLNPGERRTVEELIYGILLKSANDAAVALAEHIGSSSESFSYMMNRKAKDVGANDTHFVNPHGLYDINHYSTAYDLAVIARYGLGISRFKNIVRTKEYSMPWPGNAYPRKFENHNELIKRYPVCDGIKTGYVGQSGHCLVASATKNNNQLISVVLGCKGSENCYIDSQNLLEYGFNGFKKKKLAEKGKVMRTIVVAGVSNINLVASRNLTGKIRSDAPIEKEINIDTKELVLPLLKNQKVGEVIYKQANFEIGRVSLVTQNAASKPNLLTKILIFLDFLFDKKDDTSN